MYRKKLVSIKVFSKGISYRHEEIYLIFCFKKLLGQLVNEVNGTVYYEDSEVRNQIINLYEFLYKKTEFWRPTEDGFTFSFIAEADKLVLVQDFEKDEIVKALKKMRGDKAPRMNGYYYGIFQHCWWAVKGDAINEVAWFVGLVSESTSSSCSSYSG